MPVLTSGQQERKSKQRKIRNSEYYDMEGTFDRLYAESKKDKTFNHLMEIIENEENIKLAYRTIKKNTGSDTSGVDKRTIADLAKLSEGARENSFSVLSMKWRAARNLCAVFGFLLWRTAQSTRAFPV